MGQKESQSRAPSGRRRPKKGLRRPRHTRTTESYRYIIDEALAAFVTGQLPRADAYAIRDLAMSGAELLLSWGMQKASEEGVIEADNYDELHKESDGDSVEIEGSVSDAEWTEDDDANCKANARQPTETSKIVTLIPIAGGRQDDDGDE